MPFKEDGHDRDAVVGHYHSSMRIEGLAVGGVLGGEGLHVVGLRVKLVLEELGQASLCHILQQGSAFHWVWCGFCTL